MTNSLSRDIPRDIRIQRILETAFSPQRLLIENHSSHHAGHNAIAMSSNDTHYKITIKSDHFAKKSRVETHRIIMETLAEEFNTGLHALEIVAS